MTGDKTNQTPNPRRAESERSDGAIRDLLDGFVLALQRGEPHEVGFHEAMEALLAVGERMHASTPVDSELMATLGSLRRLSVEDVLAAHLPKGRRVGTRQKVPIGTIPLDRVEQWLDTIRSTLASLQGGEAPHRSLTAYAQYLGDHGPGPNPASFVRLA